jgi:hypothetical protein
MLHEELYETECFRVDEDACRSANGTYCFDYALDGYTFYLKTSFSLDLSFASSLGGSLGTSFGYSGLPCFFSFFSCFFLFLAISASMVSHAALKSRSAFLRAMMASIRLISPPNSSIKSSMRSSESAISYSRPHHRQFLLVFHPLCVCRGLYVCSYWTPIL